jgi:hypothetical protein
MTLLDLNNNKAYLSSFKKKFKNVYSLKWNNTIKFSKAIAFNESRMLFINSKFKFVLVNILKIMTITIFKRWYFYI